MDKTKLPTFDRRGGGITAHGQRYEVHVAFWVLLKALQRKIDFLLACNVDRFGNFDDVVFKYQYNDQWHLLLVQLKHKSSKKEKNPLIDEKFLQDQLMTKCYNSYTDIINGGKTKDIFSNVAIENIHFVLFTNARFVEHVKLIPFHENAVNDYLIINTFDNTCKSFRFDETYYQRCFDETYKDYVKKDKREHDRNRLLKHLQEKHGKNYISKEEINKMNKEEIVKKLEEENIEQHFNKTNFERFLQNLIIIQHQPDEKSLSKFNQDELFDMNGEDGQRSFHDIVEKITRWHETSNIAMTKDNIGEIFQDSVEEQNTLLSKYFGRLDCNKCYVPRIISNAVGEEKAIDERILNPSEFKSALILVADAGAGKTTILNYLSQVQVHNVKTIRISLHSNNFEGMDICKVGDDVQLASYLKHFLKYKISERYTQILQYTKNDHFFILLDGYDEIFFGSDEVVMKINSFLKVLSFRYNIFITTRKSYETKIQQNIINSAVYYIKDLNATDQNIFAQNFFKNYVKDPHVKFDDKFNEIVDKIMKIKHPGIFLTVPLQLKMFLTLFVKKFPSYYKGDEQIHLNIKINHLFDLYSMFIEKKIEIYMDRCGMSELRNYRKKEQAIKKIYEDHEYYAMKFFHLIEKSHERPLEQTHDLIEIGFISNIAESGQQVEFVHETYADFFYARMLLSETVCFKGKIIFNMETDVDSFLCKLINTKLAFESAEKFNILNDPVDINAINKNQIDDFGRSPLHIAVMIASENVIRLLIQDEIDVNITDLFCKTPLHYAIKHNLFDIVKLLIDTQKCNITLGDNRGETCLHTAIHNGSGDIINLLLQQSDCPINMQNNLLETPLKVAIAKKAVHIACALIVDERCQLNVVDRNGDTYLHWAVKYESIQIVELLLGNKCPIDLQNKDKQTALHYAVQLNLPVIVALLVESGSDYNIKDMNQKSPLDYAVSDKNLIDIVNIIHRLQMSQKPSTSTNNCNKSLNLNIVDKHVENAKLVVEKDNKNQFEMSQKPSTSTDNCNKSLNLKVVDENVENTNLVEEDRENQLNTQTNHCEYTTPALHRAIIDYDKETAISLINSEDCNLDIRDANGLTCLHYAVSFQCIPIIQKLLAHEKCPINAQDNNKQTALHYAANDNLIGITKLLMGKNCDYSIKDSMQNTAYDLARQKNYSEILDILYDKKGQGKRAIGNRISFFQNLSNRN